MPIPADLRKVVGGRGLRRIAAPSAPRRCVRLWDSPVPLANGVIDSGMLP